MSQEIPSCRGRAVPAREVLYARPCHLGSGRGDVRFARLSLLTVALTLIAGAVEASVTLPGLDEPPPGHTDPLRFGALLSFEGAVGNDDATRRFDGFDITEARVSVDGRLEQGFGYFLQGKLDKTPALQDLILSWTSPVEIGFRARAGYFRVPLSGELQIAAPNLDLLDRSQVVQALAAGRQIGIELGQAIVGRTLGVRAGVFNGNGLSTNDSDGLLYTLRFEGEQRLGAGDSNDEDAGWTLQYGASGGWSRDRSANLGLDLPRGFDGERAIGGADLRLTRGPVFFSTEGLYASLDPDGGRRADVWGYQATVAWHVSRFVQVLARYDSFHAERLAEDRDIAIGSVVLTFSKYVSLQTELRVPTRGADPTPGGILDLTFQF